MVERCRFRRCPFVVRTAQIAEGAALHDEAASAGTTDWPQIATLYQALRRLEPSPVVELNVAVAVAMADGPALGLAMMDGLVGDGSLDGYPYLHAARADLLRRLSRWSEAVTAYRLALTLTDNRAEQAFLERRIAEIASWKVALPSSMRNRPRRLVRDPDGSVHVRDLRRLPG